MQIQLTDTVLTDWYVFQASPDCLAHQPTMQTKSKVRKRTITPIPSPRFRTSHWSWSGASVGFTLGRLRFPFDTGMRAASFIGYLVKCHGCEFVSEGILIISSVIIIVIVLGRYSHENINEDNDESDLRKTQIELHFR